MSLTPLVQVFILDIGTSDIFELPFTSIQTITELNNGSSATIHFDYSAIKGVADSYGTTVKDLFTATLREVQIEYNKTLVWRGVISEYNRSKSADGTYTMAIAVIDYFSLLQKRRTGLTEVDFTAVDPATIPWSLINTSQALTHGDLGITEGATDTTGLSVTVAYKNSELKSEIAKLSNLFTNGSFDFDIDLTKKFNVYYPTKGTVRPEIVLDINNILADTVKIPVVLALTNSVFVTGQGVNNDIAAVNRQASSGDIAAYTLLEDVISDPNVSDTGILNAEGDKFLALNKLPLYQISLKHAGDDPDFTLYDVGDTLVVNIPEENVSYAQYRVRKKTVDIDPAGSVTVQLDMLII
jgi:hypothetical protein